MRKLKLVAVAVALGLVAGACSSGDTPNSQPATEPAEATQTVTPPAEATTTEVAEFGAEVDCDSGTGANTVETAIEAVIVCLRQAPPDVIDDTLWQFFMENHSTFYDEVSYGTYTRIVEPYGSEATLVLVSSTVAAVSFAFAENPLTLIERSETATDGPPETELGGCVAEATGYDLMGVLDVTMKCVAEASTGDIQSLLAELEAAFGVGNVAELVRLYGVEATVVIPTTLAFNIFGGLPTGLADR